MKKLGNNNPMKQSKNNFNNIKNTINSNFGSENKYETFQITTNHTEPNYEVPKAFIFSEKELSAFQEHNVNCLEEPNYNSSPNVFPNALEKINLNNLSNMNSNKNNNNKDKDNIKVAVRIRPRNHKESENCNLIDVMHNTIKLKTKQDEIFVYDFVASEEINQEQMFEKCAKEVVDNVLQGYNGTIFAYGQTSAGKTYTLIGSKENINEKINKYYNPNLLALNQNGNVNAGNNIGCADIKKFLNLNSEKRGIIPRAIEYILKNFEKANENDVSLSCSFFEIYNDELRDLLEDKNVIKKMEIREINENQEEEIKSKNKSKFQHKSNLTGLKTIEDKNNNEKEKKIINISNLKKVKFQTYIEAIQYLSQGLERRKVGETKMNEESSRSHAIFSIYLGIKQSDTKNINKSVFHMVDLAGSERQSDTGAIGARLNESGQINNSLMVLKMVIENLDPSKKLAHIPYRDSRLTFALKDSLGGNAKTCIIANISPANSNIQETFSTLQFGKLARKVKNEARINQEQYNDLAIEEALFTEKEKNRKLISENAKLIKKQKEQKEKYEELYEQFLTCLNKLKNQNENEMDICNNQASNELDPKLVFGHGIEKENLNNFNNNFNNNNFNDNYKTNANLKPINDDSTREDYKITYENCFKELEILQEELKSKEIILLDKKNKIEYLYWENLERDSLIKLLKKEIENLKEKNSKLCKDNKAGDSDLTNIMLRNSELENEIHKLKDIIEDKKQELERKNEQIKLIENNYKNKSEMYEERLKNMEKKLNDIHEERHKKEQTIKILENELEIKAYKIKELRDAIENLEKDKKSLKNNIEDNFKLVEKKEKEIEMLIEQKAEISEKGKELIRNYEDSLEKKEEEKHRIEEELKVKRDIINQNNNLIINLNQRYLKIVNELDQKKRINLNLVTENKNYQKQLDIMNEREKELKNKIEVYIKDLSELTRSDNPKNAAKINLIERQRNQIEEFKSEIKSLRVKETVLNNLIRKVRIVCKNTNKTIQPEQIESYVIQTENLNKEYKDCLEESIQKIEEIIFKSKRQYHEFSFLFNIRYNLIESDKTLVDAFQQRFQSITSFVEFLLEYAYDRQRKLNDQDFLLLNMNKWKTINEFNSSATKSKQLDKLNYNKENQVDSINSNFTDKNKESKNYPSLILENISKSEKVSNLTSLKFKTKRKSSENRLKNFHNFENITSDQANIHGFNKPSTPIAKIKFNYFEPIDQKSGLIFQNVEKSFTCLKENNKNFKNNYTYTEQELKNLIKETEKFNDLKNNDENKINSNFLLNEQSQENSKSKFLNPYLISVNENTVSGANSNNLQTVAEEKIEYVNNSLDKMDIIN